METTKLSPIVLFVYNRLIHTKKTVEALKKNKFASDSELIIYSDAAKNEASIESVRQIRQYLDSINGFKKKTIIKRENNWGLADSIIDGVTNVVNRYGKVIVLEDDLVTSPYFLKYMNEALEFYKNYKKVWHISGWNYPVDAEGLGHCFLWRVMNCWGWATWANRWQYYERDVDKTIKVFSKKDIRKFNLEGACRFWDQVVYNKRGKINTWAIFWYATIFKNSGLCLNPAVSFVQNIGLDGSGIHCLNNDNRDNIRLNQNSNVRFESMLTENKLIVDMVSKYLYQQRKPLLVRARNKILKVFPLKG